MDIFKFESPTSPTKLEFGEIINGIRSKMWIERYREAGEFTLVANVDSGIREKLPIGSVISHTDTTEVMIVENHEISEDKGKEAEIVISGRGFETFFENRVVGSNKIFPTSSGVADYVLAAGFTYDQAATLISDHILAINLVDDDDSVPYASVLATASDLLISEERIVKRGDLYSRLMELLEIDGLGIKVVRPGPWSPLPAGSPNMAIVIHAGSERSDVRFSYDAGEIANSDYLWSSKGRKNVAMVSGRWVEVLVSTYAGINFDRRTMHVDASDIDSSFSEAPAGLDLDGVIHAMEQRGYEALYAQRDISLVKVDISKESVKAVYRRDFDVGDVIRVSSDYIPSSRRRVSEYVEIEDENGENGYPTLTDNDLPAVFIAS